MQDNHDLSSSVSLPVLPLSLTAQIPRDRIFSKRQLWTMYKQIIRDSAPYSPPVGVVNPLQPYDTPDWDWSYSEKIWRSPRVPSPEDRHLRGCGCVGVCDPNSQTCSCLQLNRRFGREHYDGFPYEERVYGSQTNPNKIRIKNLICPVFECSAWCTCSPSCINRVRTISLTSLHIPRPRLTLGFRPCNVGVKFLFN